MKTLTQIAREIAAQVERTKAPYVEKVIETYVQNWKAETLSAYLANPDSDADGLIEELVFLGNASSVQDVCLGLERVTDELESAFDEATDMIAYRVDCILNPEDSFECPEE